MLDSISQCSPVVIVNGLAAILFMIGYVLFGVAMIRTAALPRWSGVLPAPGGGASGDVVEAARRYFRGQDVVVEPRKMWPSGLPHRKGKIRFLAPGRALAFADDPA